jgi:gas vesicle protein
MENNNSGKGFLTGLLAGGIIGAAIALLYAPSSGRELRAQIRVKKDELIDDTSEYLQIAKTKATELINEGKKKSEELIIDAKKKAGSLIDDANSILSEAKVKATGTIENTKEKINNEADRIKDAFKAGMDAYNEEKKKKS